MAPGIDNRDQRWESRLLRIRELEHQHKAIAPTLQFYSRILEFQADVSLRFTCVANPDAPLRAQIGVAAVAAEMATLLSLAASCGPQLVRDAASQWKSSGAAKWHEAIESALVPNSLPVAATDDFFTRACLQPVAENLQLQLSEHSYTGSHVCPACAGLPQLAVLHPEGDAAGRWLLCSFCLREWPFRRLICPWCREEDKEKLPRYSSADWPAIHIEACDTCRRYLKTIDMTVDGLAVPLIDETALSVLDVWAADRGYTKIVPSLMGF